MRKFVGFVCGYVLAQLVHLGIMLGLGIKLGFLFLVPLYVGSIILCTNLIQKKAPAPGGGARAE